MSQWIIRNAQDGDRDTVHELLLAADLCYEDIAAHLTRGFVVAECAGAIVGTAGLELCDDSGLLRSVVVEPTFRGTGIGAALIRNRLDHAREVPLRSVYLLTLTAERYFARLGFTAVGRASVPTEIQQTVEFSRLCPESAVVMVLSLD
jgi:amino-acid N-acetyltransferase